MRMIKQLFHKFHRVLLICIASIFCLSISGAYYYDLLSFEDWERFNQQSAPVLSAALDEDPYWESFNEWHCYSTKNIQFECTELDFGLRYVPTIRISDSSDLYDYSLDPGPVLDCGKTLDEWKNLIEGEEAFCVYSAYLQDLPDESYEAEGIRHWSLWILEDIKTNNGYWKGVDIETEEPFSLKNVYSGA